MLADSGLGSHVNSDDSQICILTLLSWVSALYIWLFSRYKLAVLLGHNWRDPKVKCILLPPFIPVKIIPLPIFPSSSSDYQSLMARKKPGSLLSDSKWHCDIDIGCLASFLLCRSWTEHTVCSLILTLILHICRLCLLYLSSLLLS